MNPVALARAAFRTYAAASARADRRSRCSWRGSTYRLNTRTPAGKLRQIGAALWLEARYSKRELLEAYLNVVPFGGNIQGVGAASRIYFGKPPDRVTLGEALTLAVIPQRPASRAGRDRVGSRPARRARAARTPLAGASRRHRRRTAGRSSCRSSRGAQFAMPWQAPHFVDALLAEPRAARRPGASTRRSTRACSGCSSGRSGAISRSADDVGHPQRRGAARRHARHVGQGVGRLGRLLERRVDGQVNGVLAKRSPGSTLKPFVYALALDQGVLHPQTMLRDAPTSFGPFTPENFDGRFFGPITAEEALIRSRNVPAVWVADAADAAEPVPVPAERRRARPEAGVVLRAGAARSAAAR